MSRATLSELFDRLCAARIYFPEGSVIRHYKKGDLYVVTGHCIREFDGQPSVTFEAGPIPFNRPLSEMIELVDHEGSIVPRFEVLEND